MAFELSQELKNIINDGATVAVISAVGKNGFPYAQKPHKISLRDDGRIAIHQLLEKSQIQKNLVYSLWYSKDVSLVLVAKDGRSFHLYVKPYQALVAGREFTAEYNKVLAEFGDDADLSTVWLLDVVSVNETTYAAEHAQEKSEHPYLYHMDHIVKKEYRS